MKNMRKSLDNLNKRKMFWIYYIKEKINQESIELKLLSEYNISRVSFNYGYLVNWEMLLI
jgi:hypothetical protein